MHHHHRRPGAFIKVMHPLISDFRKVIVEGILWKRHAETKSENKLAAKRRKKLKMEGKTMQDQEVFPLCDQIRETAFALHKYLRHGHLEKVYENGLKHRLIKSGFTVEDQFPLKVLDEDGAVLGEYFADLFVSETLIVEIKACRALDDAHTAQLLGYLRACRIEHGLLINFGAPKLQIKKYALSDPQI